VSEPTEAWDLLIDRHHLTKTRLQETVVADPAAGHAVLRTSRVGLTANNATYAVLGDTLRYWEFFPAPAGWGRVPLWGFADVVASRADGVDVGQRVYGFLPTSSHLVVRPERVGEHGFRDGAEHRSALPAVYNAYAETNADPAYQAGSEDLQVLYRPLFITSFTLAEQLRGAAADGARTLMFSSASSKTAYGTAALLQGGPKQVVGLTSPANVAFTRSLGCYDRVLGYHEVDQLTVTPTAYVDVAGSQPLRERVHARLREDVVLDVVVGVTHQDTGRASGLLGAKPTQFFAPEVIAARIAKWGRAGFDERYGVAWRSFAPRAQQWVDVVTGQGPARLREVWRQTVDGNVGPRTGNVVTFGPT